MAKQASAATAEDPVPASQGSKSEQVYESLRSRIADGSLGPGFRLVLDQIAKELSVSPVPVREAIRRLEAEGYVVFRRNVGAHVAVIDSATYAHTMEVLAYLEGAATGLAAPMISESVVREARQINERMRASREQFDPLSFTRLNQQFHEVICGECPNPHLLQILRREWQRMDIIRTSTFSIIPGRANTSVEEHDHILDLIISAAPRDEIGAAARQHKLATLEAFLARER
jgi:DNA-binding GntR family transcriptional regulator